MTTSVHANLTGTDLHEVKGASSATVGQVPIANGSGNAPFGLIGPGSLAVGANPFGAQLLHVREEQTSGTASSTPTTTGTFITTSLNTVKTNEISGASLTTSQITLPAGTYFIDGSMPAVMNTSSGAAFTQARLYNLTTATALIYGQAVYLGGASSEASDYSQVRGRFTLSGTTVVIFQHQKGGGIFPGRPASYGTEVYAEVLIWKVL